MTIATRLRDSKAVYAVAGAGDLAVEKIREVPEQVTKVRETVTKYQDQVRETVTKRQGEVRETVAKRQGELRENVSKLQDRVEVKDIPGAAVAYVTHIGTRAVELVDELAERGKRVVNRTAEDVVEITEAKPEPKPKPVAARRTTATRSTGSTTKKA
jgi:hypothetical protein